jgi:hypothetical protein
MLCVPEIDPDLCRNTMKYKNTHEHRDATKIRLHFINNKMTEICVIFFVRVVVSERLRWACRGVRGGGARPPLRGCRGAEPPAWGFGGSAPEIFFLGRHISGTTYFRDHMILGGFRHMVFADGFSISG